MPITSLQTLFTDDIRLIYWKDGSRVLARCPYLTPHLLLNPLRQSILLNTHPIHTVLTDDSRWNPLKDSVRVLACEFLLTRTQPSTRILRLSAPKLP